MRNTHIETWMMREKGVRHRQQGTLFGDLRGPLAVIAGVVIVSLAARNTLIWQLQKFWYYSSDFWTAGWTSIYSLFGRNDFAITALGTTMFSMVIFWIAGLCFAIVDLSAQPTAAKRFKIQSEKDFPVDQNRFLRAVGLIVFNQLLGGLASVLIYPLMKWRGCQFESDQLPTFHYFLFEIVVFLFIEEIGFYYTHRLFHVPYFYKRFHKIHHEWKAPIAIIGIYCHPFEYLLSNYVPLLAGPLILGSHLASTWMWIFAAVLNTLNAHSGYHLPFLFSNEAHDFHHARFNQYFGVLGILDRLHGTDRVFRESKSFDRHFMIFGLSSARELIPDDVPCRDCSDDDSE